MDVRQPVHLRRGEQAFGRRTPKERNGRTTAVVATGNDKKIRHDDLSENITPFSGILAHGAVENSTLEDQGYEGKLLDRTELKILETAMPCFCAHEPPAPDTYTLVDAKQRIKVDKHFNVGINLCRRNGTNLMLREVGWLVSDVENEQVTIGRPLFDSNG